jgi:hypothetical protein
VAARPADQPPSELLVAGAFAVDAAHKLTGAAGGLPAFRATDRRAGGRTGLMAVQVRPDAPARANALARFASQTIAGVLTPLACGPAQVLAMEAAAARAARPRAARRHYEEQWDVPPVE